MAVLGGEVRPHPAVAQLSFLLGRWAGEGEGEYPTVESFAYGEEITFSHMGKPFVAYTQRTWNLETGNPLHAEMGYLRCPGPGRLELVVAHPTGHAELSSGSVGPNSLELEARSLACARNAKPVTELVRRLRVDSDVLSYELDMAAVGTKLCRHLRAVLRRVART